jgi:hypothetical protein
VTGKARSREASASRAPLMTEADLELFILRIALPPVRLGIYLKRLAARRGDPTAAAVVRSELRRAERIHARLTRQGWWN